MFVCLLLVFLMLIPTTVSTPPADHQDCMSGWFGENCMYKCHCAHSKSCAINGDCPQGEECETGFFGPACQYVNLVTGYVSLETEPYIRDGNDSSCNPKVKETVVEVVLKKAFPFSWFRILFKREVPELKMIKVRLNDAVRCDNKRTYKVSSTELDISCDTTILVTRLTITGAIASVVCTISISGGRNVALRQEASQSSNLTNEISRGMPSRAVDGNTSNDYEESWSCSTTGIEESGPEWYLDFNRPQILFRIVIYNRGGALHKRLRGFSLKTFAEDGTETNYFKDTSKTASLVYEINLLSRVPVVSLMIKGGTILSLRDRLLTLCEVETYGETVCPSDTYGIYCNDTCQCHFGGVCNLITGLCERGCNPGTYGYNCSSVCSEKCLNFECSERDGGCLHCVPGHMGHFCNEKCKPGTFGLLCQGECSKYCDMTCNFITGHCNCTEGHEGQFCTECPVGKYGENCSFSCPPMCKDQLCDQENGFCLSCTGAHIGPACEDCPQKYYGENCYSPCSEYCLNSTCDYKSGNCFQCIQGYSGDKCLQGQKPKTEFEYMFFLPLPILLVIFCIGLWHLLCKRKVSKSDNNEG